MVIRRAEDSQVWRGVLLDSFKLPCFRLMGSSEVRTCFHSTLKGWEVGTAVFSFTSHTGSTGILQGGEWSSWVATAVNLKKALNMAGQGIIKRPSSGQSRQTD